MGKQDRNAQDHDVHHALVRLLRPSEDAARRARPALQEINLDDDPHFRRTLNELTGGWTVPQIVIDERPIGGYTELWRLDKSGALETLTA